MRISRFCPCGGTQNASSGNDPRPIEQPLPDGIPHIYRQALWRAHVPNGGDTQLKKALRTEACAHHQFKVIEAKQTIVVIPIQMRMNIK